jgi:purine nucleosidase
MPAKLILDTDIGSDIDDALCLAYLLSQPNCELLGITTVTGESTERAKMASAMCKIAGKQIPIFPGAEQPLLIRQRQTHAPQAAALSRWEHDEDFPEVAAIEFLRQTIRQNPHEVTLLCIGPLTNIGLLFAVDREIPRLLKQIVLMCGTFTNYSHEFGPLEWNAVLDPHATAIVYRAPVPIHRSIGTDITSKVQMHAQEVRRRFTTPLLKLTLDFAEIWFKSKDVITFHDPLAATTIFDETICGFQQGNVEIDLSESPAIGQTLWKPDEPGANHEVAVSVNSTRFFDHYFATLAGSA